MSDVDLRVPLGALTTLSSPLAPPCGATAARPEPRRGDEGGRAGGRAGRVTKGEGDEEAEVGGMRRR